MGRKILLENFVKVMIGSSASGAMTHQIGLSSQLHIAKAANDANSALALILLCDFWHNSKSPTREHRRNVGDRDGLLCHDFGVFLLCQFLREIL